MMYDVTDFMKSMLDAWAQIPSASRTAHMSHIMVCKSTLKAPLLHKQTAEEEFMSFSWLWRFVSMILGSIDYAFYFLVRLAKLLFGKKRVPHFLSKGWGHDASDSVETVLPPILAVRDRMERLDGSAIPEFLNITDSITYGRIIRDSHNVTIQDNCFPSPEADLLPEESKNCQYYQVAPAKGQPTSNVVVLMLPSTGEQWALERLVMARQLARRHGHTSLILTAPLYGCRSKSVLDMIFDNVADFMGQNAAIIQEAAALILHHLEENPEAKVCVTGFSWGGAITGLAAGVALSAGADASRLALVPYIGSIVPTRLRESLISEMVDHEAFGGWGVLLGALDSFRLDNLFQQYLDQNRPGPSIGAIRCVTMGHDYMITQEAGRQLADEMEKLAAASEYLGEEKERFRNVWLPGGHFFGAFLRPYVQYKAIVEAVEAL